MPVSSSQVATDKRLVLGCGALVYELVELTQQNAELKQKIDLHCLPAHLHNTPQFIAREVDLFLLEHAHKYQDIFVAYADCGSAGDLDKVLAKHNAQRLPGAHCYEFFAGAPVYESMLDEELGSFFLTDYLVQFFERIVMQGLGLNDYPELRDMYFKHYTRLIYLAQTENPELQDLAKQQAKQLGLRYEYRFVGKQGLNPVIDFPSGKSLANQKIAVEVQYDPT